MAIPSKQIGWGTESNLLWQIAKQIQYLTQVAGTSLSSLISQSITCGVTDKAPSEDAVCQALLSKQDVLGKISLSDPEEYFFNDLATAYAYVKLFTDAEPTQEGYDSKTFTYTFNVPADTYFTNQDNFCSNNFMNFKDPEGLVVRFGSEAFYDNKTNNIFGNITVTNSFLYGSTGNNIIGNVFTGDYFLKSSTGNNTMNTINVGYNAFAEASPTIKNSIYKIESCGNDFALNYKGRIDVGYFGNNGEQNLPTAIFYTANLTWIHTFYSNRFNNFGAEDADIQQITNNWVLAGALNNIVIYE